MNRRRWALVIFLGVTAGLVQASLLSVLPSPWRDIQPILPAGVLLVVLNRSKAAILLVGIAGFVTHVFAVDGESFAFVWLMVTMLAVTALSQTVLTNRSVYATAALVAFARVLFQICSLLSSAFVAVMFKAEFAAPSFARLAVILAWDVVFASAGFFAVALLTRRFLITAGHSYRYDES